MTFDLETLTYKESYRLLVSTVVPRPIALVTTTSLDGKVNAAPFSFFNVMAHDPPVLVLGIERRRAGVSKDTARNIRDTQEFVVNLVSEKIAPQMNVTAVDFPTGTDEVEAAGLTPLASTKVAVPRIAEAPVSLECRERLSLGIGEGRTLVVGDIVALHVDDDFYEAETNRIKTAEMGLIGRMHGGDWYVRTTDLFRMERVRLEQLEQFEGDGA